MTNLIDSGMAWVLMTTGVFAYFAWLAFKKSDQLESLGTVNVRDLHRLREQSEQERRQWL